MDKEIQEMAQVLCDAICHIERCSNCTDNPCEFKYITRILFNMGYRKADEVRNEDIRKETAKEILQEIAEIPCGLFACKSFDWFKKLCAKYGVEIGG